MSGEEKSRPEVAGGGSIGDDAEIATDAQTAHGVETCNRDNSGTLEKTEGTSTSVNGKCHLENGGATDLPGRAEGTTYPPEKSIAQSEISIKIEVDDEKTKRDDDSIVDHLNFREVSPVSLRFRKVAVTANDKRILEQVDGDAPPGTLTAILGSSGSGKTTLLNVLANRFNRNKFDVEGEILFNGVPSRSKDNAAYVMQEDVLQPTLTVREVLGYAAELRLPGHSHEERRDAVKETILQLGLKQCADTRIGDTEHKGCSGGEKRRTSIGQQMLSNPSVLFLDEPTTGLDATSAFQVVQTLSSLAKKGRTVVMTIHQPRSEIWNLLDNVILLSRGRQIYSGPTSGVASYFAGLGHPLPEHANPADFLIDLTAIDYRSPEAEAQSHARVNSLAEAWRNSASLPPEKTALTDLETTTRGSPTEEHSSVSFGRQVAVQTRRTIKTSYRDPLGMMGILIEAISMGVLCGWIFYNLDRGYNGIRSRQGAVYNAAALQGYLILLFESYRISVVDIKVFDREYNEGVVGIISFLLSRRLGKLFMEDIPVPLLFSVIFYFMTGLDLTAVKFFTFFSVVLIGQFIAVSFATVSVAISRDFSKASLFVNLLYTVMSLSCGYFAQGESMGPQVKWVKWISYVYYSFGALAANEFSGEFYDCPQPNDGPTDIRCAQFRGDYILTQLGFRENWITVPIVACVGFAVGAYLAAGILLKLKPVGINVGKVQLSDARDLSAGKEAMRVMTGQEETVTVVIKDYNLDIHKISATKHLPKWLKSKPDLNLKVLRNVSSVFKPGQLNVIMGPSGSGKSTLLNAMAGRLDNSMLTKYKLSGHMYFNGAIPSKEVVKSLCSYVTQDDNALYPSLTVRETIYFAALIRLPTFWTKEQKLARADEVILKLGLKECADTIIGSEFQKGISGGEKRRVSIAIQILTMPKVLLLDEPTSGLDAFTAASILEVLKGLAEEGRVVILTIHQSRSDLFKKFGTVLLLARGGSPVYSGEAKDMLEYLENRGHVCPPRTNPADFALDVITVNLQRSDREETSRARVAELISAFPSAKVLSGFKEGFHNDVISLPASLGAHSRKRTPFHIAFPVLVRRSFTNFARDKLAIIARTTQVIGMGVVMVFIFTPVRADYIGIFNRLGFVQTVLPLYFVGMLQNVAVYPIERDIFYKDHLDNAYGTLAFFLSYLAIEFPTLIVAAAIYAIPTTFAVGIPRTARMYLTLLYNAVCIVSCGESIGILFNTLVRHTGFAVNLISTILSISTLLSGIFSLNVPPVLKALNYLSPLGYSVRTVAQPVFQGQTFSCPEELGQCPLTDGDTVLRQFDIKSGYGDFLGLAGVMIVYRVLTGLVLAWKMRGWRLPGMFRRK